MNRDETKKAIEVMQAYVDGAEIEFKYLKYNMGRGWRGITDVCWDWYTAKYRRIKPKPREFCIQPKAGIIQVLNNPNGITNEWITVREVL